MSEVPQTIACSFVDRDALHYAYMSFVKGGGLFVRENSALTLGTKVILEIRLMDEPDSYQMEAQVVWLTPKEVIGMPVGMGFQFIGGDRRVFSNKIESYLGGRLKSTQPTDMM